MDLPLRRPCFADEPVVRAETLDKTVIAALFVLYCLFDFVPAALVEFDVSLLLQVLQLR